MCIRSMASINIANCLYGAIWENYCIRLLITTIDTVRITRRLNFFIHIRKLPLSQQRQKKGFTCSFMPDCYNNPMLCLSLKLCLIVTEREGLFSISPAFARTHFFHETLPTVSMGPFENIIMLRYQQWRLDITRMLSC